MGWYPIRIRNKMHRHETESWGAFKIFDKSICDVLAPTKSV